MKKRTVLFVDDELKILKGLRRMLYPLHNDWDIVYVESGAGALQIIEQNQPAVLISDMRMPGMNGLELMEIVRKQYPAVIRVMLTGQPDKNLYCEVMSICHYFLWKPTSFEVFEALLGRIKELDTSLQDEKIFKIIGGITNLPSLPALFIRLTDLLAQPETDSAQIAEVVQNDMAMTTMTLKLVNSAFFSLSRPVTNLQDAISFLGMDTIRNLVLIQHLFSQCTPKEYQEFKLDQLWQHSFCVAALSEKIVSTQCKIDRHNNCHSYLAGLLHDIGKLIFMRHFTDIYRKIIADSTHENKYQPDIEKEHLGVDHAAIGGYLASLWGLPREIVEAISLHHKETKLLSGASPVLEAVWHANRICHGDFSLSDSNYAAYSLGKQFVSHMVPSPFLTED
jgi:putative nucleotidyltransferase with HDIG domain